MIYKCVHYKNCEELVRKKCVWYYGVDPEHYDWLNCKILDGSFDTKQQYYVKQELYHFLCNRINDRVRNPSFSSIPVKLADE